MTLFKWRVVLCGLVLAVLSGCGDASAVKIPEIIKTKSGVEMVLIPAGSFLMGSATGGEDERPAHTVVLDAFLMDKTEFTQAQVTALQIADGSHFKNPQNPVEQVRWNDAAIICNARSKAEGLTPCYNEDNGECNFDADGYRLPTEAEWEYACRAGSKAAFCYGADDRKLPDYAWLGQNSANKTHPVGQKHPNAWGLCDMHGNVAEWCQDLYDKDYYKTTPPANPHGAAAGDKYVLRGGAWDSAPEATRCSARAAQTAGFTDACFKRDQIGFRCVRKAAAAVK